MQQDGEINSFLFQILQTECRLLTYDELITKYLYNLAEFLAFYLQASGYEQFWCRWWKPCGGALVLGSYPTESDKMIAHTNWLHCTSAADLPVMGGSVRKQFIFRFDRSQQIWRQRPILSEILLTRTLNLSKNKSIYLPVKLYRRTGIDDISMKVVGVYSTFKKGTAIATSRLLFWGFHNSLLISICFSFVR